MTITFQKVSSCKGIGYVLMTAQLSHITKHIEHILEHSPLEVINYKVYQALSCESGQYSSK